MKLTKLNLLDSLNVDEFLEKVKNAGLLKHNNRPREFPRYSLVTF